MLLDLSEEHKEHLAFLPKVDSAVVAEFGRIAVEFLRRGSNPKIYEGAARKLSVSSDTVQHGVEGLIYLLTESSKLMISELDFQDSVFVLGFPEELNKLLLQLYLDNRKEIRTILSELAPDLPSYHSLEWRLDVQLASRSLRQQIKPSVTIKLHLNRNGDHDTQVLQTDPATLLHLVQQLEQALEEMKTNHCRRVVRNINLWDSYGRYTGVVCRSLLRRRRGRKRMRQLDGITDAMDMNLGKLQEMVGDREA